MLAGLPPVPDDVVVRAHPADVARGLLVFLQPKPNHGLLTSMGGLPVYEDKSTPEGTAVLWNKTKDTVELIDISGVKA
jgi:hypothetical protein